MIVFSFQNIKNECHERCKNFRNEQGIPDSVETKPYRQEQNARNLKDQSAKERDGCRHGSVVERREKGGTERFCEVYTRGGALWHDRQNNLIILQKNRNMPHIFQKTVDFWSFLLYIVSDEFVAPLVRGQFTVCFVGAGAASLNIPVVTDEGTRPSGGVLAAVFLFLPRFFMKIIERAWPSVGYAGEGVCVNNGRQEHHHFTQRYFQKIRR